MPSRMLAATLVGLIAVLLVPARPVAAVTDASDGVEGSLAEAVALFDPLFDAEAAHGVAADMDRYYRVRGNEGYMRSLGILVEYLEDGGFGDDAGDAIELYDFGPVRPAWTPRSASLDVISPDVGTLHAFSDESGLERTFLCVNSFPTPPEGLVAPVVRYEPSRPAETYAGTIVYSADWPSATLFARAVEEGGAWGVISGYLPDYNEPDVYRDTIRFSYVPYNAERRGFGLNVSPSKAKVLERLLNSGAVYVRVRIEAHFSESRASTLVARIRGTDPEAGTIALAAHLDEPGANDNASGVATMAEMATCYLGAIRNGRLERPRRGMTFIWGQEFECTKEWLATAPGPVDAGMIIDMVGQDFASNGALPLVERVPDPGAIWDRPPLDIHSEWGRGDVRESDLHGTYLNDYVMAAMHARAAGRDWPVRSNPFEGGSDHESFLERGIPAVLVWHFTDPYYHTSLDRIDKVSATELANVGVATLGLMHHVGHAGLQRASEVLDIVMAAARRRLAVEADNARSFLEVEAVAAHDVQREAVLTRERRILSAWGRWYREAVLSLERFEPNTSAAGWPAFQRRVDQAVAELRQLEWDLVESLEG